MIFWTTFGIFALCLILESITSWAFIRGSKKKHHELWVHAGEPTLMGNGDLINAWPLNKYLVERRYKEIENEAAKAFAEYWRLPFILSYFSAIVSTTIFLSVSLSMANQNNAHNQANAHGFAASAALR